MRRRISRLGEVLRAAVARMGLDARLRAEMAPLVWPDVVGPEVARRTRPTHVRDGILFVVTRTSSWAQELTFLKPHLLAGLNARLGAEVIRDIRFRSGAWPREAVSEGEVAGEAGSPSAGELGRVRLARGEREAVEGLAGFVDDPELRARYRRFLLTGRRLRAWRLAHGWRPCPACGAPVRPAAATCPACGKAMPPG